MKIGELFFNLGFNADTIKLKDFGKAIGDLNMSSILTAGSFGALYEGAKSLINMADEVALSINNFGIQTGQSTQEIQKWGKMAERVGIPASVMQNSITSLVDSLYLLKRFGTNSNFWGQLGLNPNETADKFRVLDSLADRIKNMDTDATRYYLHQLGLDTQLLNILKLSKDERREILNIYAQSEDKLAKTSEHHKEMVTASQALKDRMVDVGESLTPISTAFDHWASTLLEIVGGSKIWENIVNGIAYGIEENAKGNLFKDIGKLIQASDPGKLYGLNLVNPMDPRTALGPASNPNILLKINAKVNTKDPNTTVEFENDSSYKQSLEDAYRQSSSGSN